MEDHNVDLGVTKPKLGYVVVTCACGIEIEAKTIAEAMKVHAQHVRDKEKFDEVA